VTAFSESLWVVGSFLLLLLLLLLLVVVVVVVLEDQLQR
jgi:hypothetical protein